jgi:hypothetical protein
MWNLIAWNTVLFFFAYKILKFVNFHVPEHIRDEMAGEWRRFINEELSDL